MAGSSARARRQWRLDFGELQRQLVRDTGGSGGSDFSTEDTNDTDDTGAKLIWTAVTSAKSTATGPNGESAVVNKVASESGLTGFSWIAQSSSTKVLGSGVTETHDEGRIKAQQAVTKEHARKKALGLRSDPTTGALSWTSTTAGRHRGESPFGVAHIRPSGSHFSWRLDNTSGAALDGGSAPTLNGAKDAANGAHERRFGVRRRLARS